MLNVKTLIGRTHGWGALIISLIAICFYVNIVWAQEAFRYRADQEKVRIVVDVPSGTKYQDKTSGSNKIMLEISGNNQVSTTSKLLNDDLVKKISINNNGNTQSLCVDIGKIGKYKVFALAAPERIVIDIFRESSIANISFPKGVSFKEWLDYSSGQPVMVYLLQISPDKKNQIRPLLAQGKILGRASTQQIIAGSFSGINASYFDPSGSIYGNTKIDGQIVSAEEKMRTGLAIDPKLGYKIMQAAYQGQVVLPSKVSLKITGVNRHAMYTDLILYTDQYAPTTCTDNTGVEVVVVDNKVQQVIHNTGNTPIPKNGYVLSAFGNNIYELANLNLGDTVKIEQSLGEADEYKHFIGAGPCLVNNSMVAVTSSQEEFPSDISVGRAPRTAVGITASQEILFVVADGRSRQSAGFTLEQLAKCMISLGAVQAFNLDGGGSSTFILNGYVRNKPSDGAQRSVALALALKVAK